MKQITTLLIFLLSMPLWAFSQTVEPQNYKSAFKSAYQACPDIPQGWLEAISFTNTHCNHLTDANYFHDGPAAMPRAYGLMGLVKDGKGYFRENLHLVARLSGISEAEILDSPEKNVLAYAKAFEHLAKESNISGHGNVLRHADASPLQIADQAERSLVAVAYECGRKLLRQVEFIQTSAIRQTVLHGPLFPVRKAVFH